MDAPPKAETKRYWANYILQLILGARISKLAAEAGVKADNSYTTAPAALLGLRKSSFKISGRRGASSRSEASRRRLVPTQHDSESINHVFVVSEVFELVRREMKAFEGLQSTVHTGYSAIGYSTKSDIVPTLTHM